MKYLISGKIIHRTGIVLSVVVMTGCSFFTSYGRNLVRAEKAYKFGNYDSAVEYCAASLSVNPGYEKSSKFMDIVFPKAIAFHTLKIDRLNNSGSEFKWDRIVSEYKDLSHLVDILEKLDLPQTEVLLFKSDAKNYKKLLYDAKIQAADAHYLAGIRIMQKEDRDSYREAADHFKTAMKYIDHYQDSAELYEICRQNAITRIAIMPFTNSSGVRKYGDLGEQVSNQLLASLMSDSELMEFVEFVTRDNIDLIMDEQQLANSGLVSEENSIEIGNILGVHQTITGSITHVSATEPQRLSDRKHLKKKIITGSETFTDEDGKEHERDVYRWVHADAVFYKIQAEAMVNVSYKIMDVATAKILHSNNLSANYTYEFEWVTYSGDKRALSFIARMLAGNQQEATPSREELVMKAVDKLTERLVADIKNTLK